MSLLESLKDYSQLRTISREDMNILAGEIREKITSVVMKNGGHLASSLGAVELVLALLRSFDPEEDRILFDVGHQAYAYKILTGRLDRFHTLRQWGGISGFPRRKESPFDHFDAGHSSTSLSAALGYAKARDVLGKKHHVVAVIGDASLLNGLAFEALNYTRESQTKVIYVLNDNTMSISPRVGGIATHLARLSSSTAYNWLKKAIKDSCSSLPRGQALENVLGKMKDHIKTIVKPVNIFDEMDINYWGPFDGHNTEELENAFDLAKKYDRPVLLHVVTVKGKGNEKAENDPTAFHGISPARPKEAVDPNARSWSEAAADIVLDMAEKDGRVVCLTAAMKCGSRLDDFASRFPDRFFDVGIAEGHMVTMAAGMAAGGLKPVVFIYSTFLQRAMDQMVHDVCMQNLPVIFAVDRAGLVGEDGETHQGLLDIPWSRPIPNLCMVAPRDEKSLRDLFLFAGEHNGPVMIRFPRGTAAPCLKTDGSIFATPPASILKPEIIESGSEWVLIGYGKTVELMLRARETARSLGISHLPSVVDLRCLKPFPEAELKGILTSHSFAVVAEDGYAAGGAGEAVAAFANTLSKENAASVSLLAIPDLFVPQGKIREQEEYCGLTPGKVVNMFVQFQKRSYRQAARI
jgi:1-deoxy-D-xylulose-5-phosphate synthase